MIPRRLVIAQQQQDAGSNGASNNNGDRFRTWMLNNARRRQEPLGERIMRMVAGASSAPIAQYIPSPVTTLHTLDPRVKQVIALLFIGIDFMCDFCVISF